jgi:sarcosine oxidase subunit alpha
MRRTGAILRAPVPMPRLTDPRFATDCTVTLDGHPVPARAGESLASALLAAGRPILSRSAKYHRPRGPFCLSGSCGSCLVRVDGDPNRRACRTPCRDGMRAETQNAWPDAAHDLLGILDPLTPGGLDVHHMLTRPLPVNLALVAFTRRLAGFGRMPDRAAPRGPRASTETFDALVLGAGPAGLGAAEVLAAAGRRVLVAERDRLPGGRLRTGLEPEAAPATWPAGVVRAVGAAGGEVAFATTATGIWRDGGSPVCLLVGDDPTRTRLVRAHRIVVCTGGHARAPGFEGDDLPGVHSGRALALVLAEHGVLPGRRIAVLGSGAEGVAIAARFAAAGLDTIHVPGPVTAARGRGRVRSLRLGDGTDLRCDVVAQGAPPSPAPELLRALGVGVDWDHSIEAFAPRVAEDGTTSAPGLLAAGEVARPVSAAEAVTWGRRAGEAARG